MKIYLLIIIFILTIHLLFIYLLYYNETINRLFKENNLTYKYITINKFIPKRNLIPISNKYKIIKNKYDFSDYHLIIYWNSDYNCNIILRRLDGEYILEDLIIHIYDINMNNSVLININKKNINEIKLNIDISIKLYQVDLNQKQTTESNKVSKACYNAIYTFIDLNSEYEYMLFDSNDRISFIKQHFNKDVLNAYNTLIPGAYKADLFRYCVLYILGGCYHDIKQIDRIPLRELIDESEEIILTEDNYRTAYYNAIILVRAKHPLMLKLINQVVKNINNKYYGTWALCPTGPCLLYNIGKHIKSKFFYKPTITQLAYVKLIGGSTIKYKNKPIINNSYHGYYKTTNNIYGILWSKKNIYKE